MHLEFRTKILSICANIGKFSRTSLTHTRPKRQYAKSTSKTTKIDKTSKPAPLPITVPPSAANIVPTPGKKKKLTLWENLPGAEKLIEVTDNNFDKIIKTHRSFLLVFYGSWCSVCKDVNKEIAKAAACLDWKEGALGICDAMDNVKLVDKFLIKKTPTLKYFRNGVHVADYIGKPRAIDIVLFMKNPPKEIKIKN